MYWYEEDIEALHNKRKELVYEPRMIFYGSSSIRLWDTLEEKFKAFKPINLGFGGSTLAACTWYFEDIFEHHRAEAIVIYAGDNDLADGRHPEEVILFLEKLILKIRKRFPNIPVSYISIKPSIARWHLIKSIHYTNKLAKELEKEYPNYHFIDVYTSMLKEDGKPNPEFYESDGLHLSKKGYDLWNNILIHHPEIFPKTP